VLAVVQQNQQVLARKKLDHALLARLARPRRNVERCREHLHQALGIVRRRQLAQPRTIRELGHDLSRDLHRESRLADTTDAGQRDETVLGQPLRDRVHLRVTPDETRDLHGQIPGQLVERP